MFSQTLQCGKFDLDLTQPVVMAVLNVTPDSFSDGGQFIHPQNAIDHAMQMVADGAAIIDVGGESTRPGAAAVSIEEETARVIPVVEALVDAIDIPVSVDTSKAAVITAAASAGASMINDVRALQSSDALQAASDAKLPVCLMHMQGEPGSMQQNPDYYDVVEDIMAYLKQRVEAALTAGIAAENILLDPGFGFGKTPGHNFRLLRELEKLSLLGYPLLVGLSRKSMIAAILDNPVEERLPASIALAVLAAERGANIIRVHDVRETVEALKMREAMLAQE